MPCLFCLFAEGHSGPGDLTYNLPANGRITLFLPDEVGRGVDVSVHLYSEASFLAERPVYFGYSYEGLSARGGHCVIGAHAPARQWFFAEGYTGQGFNEWLCIHNPGAAAGGGRRRERHRRHAGTPAVFPEHVVYPLR